MRTQNTTKTLQQEFNDCALMIKDETGGYRPATGDEIINAAFLEINQRFAQGTQISSASEAFDLFKIRLGHLQHEVFGVLWLDNRNRVITFEELFRGTIDSSAVHPREVVKSALKHNAVACILCHNHPSGMSDPSVADKVVTNTAKNALNLIDVRVLDHVIVGENNYSFAQNGLL